MSMVKCVYCKEETELYQNGVPICLRCAEIQAELKRKPASSQGTTRTDTPERKQSS